MYEDGKGVARDYAEAVKWYRLAAEQGDATGQINLGAMYYQGRGVAQDYVRAYMWADLAAAWQRRCAEGTRPRRRKNDGGTNRTGAVDGGAVRGVNYKDCD